MKLPCITCIALCLLLIYPVSAQSAQVASQSRTTEQAQPAVAQPWNFVYGIFAGSNSLMTGAIANFSAGAAIGLSYCWIPSGKKLQTHLEVLALVDVLYTLDGNWYAGTGISAGNKGAGSLEGLLYWKFAETEDPWHLRLAIRVPMYEASPAEKSADISVLASVLLPLSELAGAGVRANLLFDAVFIGVRIDIRGKRTL